MRTRIYTMQLPPFPAKKRLPPATLQIQCGLEAKFLLDLRSAYGNVFREFIDARAGLTVPALWALGFYADFLPWAYATWLPWLEPFGPALGPLNSSLDVGTSTLPSGHVTYL